MFFNNVKSININDDTIIFDNNVIDVRSEVEVRKGKIGGTKNIEMNKLLNEPQNYLKKDHRYYIMCQSGIRSKNTTKALYKLGYDVINLSGGYMGYKK